MQGYEVIVKGLAHGQQPRAAAQRTRQDVIDRGSQVRAQCREQDHEEHVEVCRSRRSVGGGGDDDLARERYE